MQAGKRIQQRKRRVGWGAAAGIPKEIGGAHKNPKE